MFKAGLYSFLLRGVGLLARFILILILARYLSPAEIGSYGLFVVLITLFLYVVGLDFYLFNTRELLAGQPERYTPFIRDQLVLHGILYISVFPLLIAIFAGGFLPWKYLLWFYPILILEHLSQETYRLFITLSQPVVANFVLFIRNGLWAYGVIIIIWYSEALRTLETVWIGWLSGDLLAVGVAIWFLRKLNWKKARQEKINWAWIIRGTRNSLLFLGATLAMRGMEFADRFFIEFYHGKTLLGVYSFYASIANIVLIFLQTGVLALYHPLLIRSFQAQDYTNYKKTFYRMGMFTLASMIGLSFISGIGIMGILWFVAKPVYNEYLTIFYWLLLNVNIMALSLLPHYGLYVRGQDRSLLLSSLAALAVAVLLNSLWVPTWHVYGAVFSTLIAMFTLMFLKYLFLWYYKTFR